MSEANSAQQAIRDGRRAVRELVHQYPEAKARAKEATNSDAWGPTSEQKLELVKIANNHSDDRELVYRALFKRLDPTSEYWMHSSKAMEVLEYFLILEVPDIVPRLHQNRETLTQLTGYHSAKHEDPVRQSQLNNSVKLKATRLLRMMDDPAYFAEEAQKVLTMMTRLGGSSAITMPVAAAPGVKRSAETSPAPQAMAVDPAPRAVQPRGSGSVPDVYHEDEEEVPPAGRRSERAAFVDHEKSPTPPRHAVEAAAAYHIPQESTRPSLFASASPAAYHAPGYVPQNPPSPQPQSASPPHSSPPGTSGATLDLFAQPPQQTVPHFQPPITTQPAAATTAALFAAPAPVATKQQPAPFPADIFGPSPPTAAAPAPVLAPAPAGRGAPPPAFDPFAEVTQAMRDEEQRKQRPQQPSNSTDFFGGGAAPAARPVEFVPTPQAQSAQGSSRASPVPQGPTGDRMTDYMFSQLAGLTSGKQAPKGETQSLEALLHNRPAH